jgi:hypothetical protein
MFSTNAIMNLWLSSTEDYTIEQANYIPTGVAGASVLLLRCSWAGIPTLPSDRGTQASSCP